MQVRNLALNNHNSYVQQVSLFVRYFDKSPEQLGPQDIRACRVYLTNEKKRRLVPSSSPLPPCDFSTRFPSRRLELRGVIPSPKKPQKLPVVLSPEEILPFRSGVRSTKHRAILPTCYGAPLRGYPSEAGQHR